MAKGIDCASPLTAATAAAIAAEGFSFVCRYVVPESYRWKRLTRREAEIISQAGMYVISVFETTARRPSEGAAAGAADGIAAYAEAKLLGQPEGSAVYFAVDYDAQAKDYDVIEQYLRAAAKQLPGYLTGVYGSYRIIEEMKKRQACDRFWQTYAWSSGSVSKYANVYQYQNGVSLAGMTVDLNDSFGQEGWWSTVAEKPLYSDVPANHWAAKSIEAVQKAGIMTGYEDGTFRPDQPLTRAEAASIVNDLLYLLNNRT